MHCKTLIHILFYIVLRLVSLWLARYFKTSRHTLTSSNFFAFPVTNTTALPVGTAMLQPFSAIQQLTVGMVKTLDLCHRAKTSTNQ